VPIALLAAALTIAGTEESMPAPQDFTQMRVVYSVPGMERAVVRRNLAYKTVGEQALGMGVYVPPGAAARLPAVILVHGGPIPPQAHAKDWGVFVSYGQMLAASGLAAVTFDHRFNAPGLLADAGGDVEAALDYVRSNAATLGIDETRIAIWVFSGGGALLSVPLREERPYVRCLVAYYAALDLQVPAPGADSGIGADLRQAFSPVHHLAARGANTPPLLVARAGKDSTWMNASIDRFVQEALAVGAPLELITHPNGQHGFDIFDNDARSREIIESTIAFLRRHLLG